MQVQQEKAQEWTELFTEELYIFIGAIIYMGVYNKPLLDMYWNTDFNKGPLHLIPTYISLNCFK